MSMSEQTIIIVHAWQWDGENQTYADPGVDKVDGWCAYVRTPTSAPGDFDIIELGDTATRDEAIALAKEAALLRCLSPIKDISVED